MTQLLAQAHAKINLALAVTATRDDGYHELRSVFLRLALHDRLEVELDPAAVADHLEVRSPEYELLSENVATERRCRRTDRGLHGHQRPQENGIHPRTHHVRLKNRTQDEYGHDGVDKHTSYKVNDHNDRNYPQHRRIGTEQRRQKLLRDLHKTD